MQASGWRSRLVGEHAEVVHARVVDQHVDATAPGGRLAAEPLPVRSAGQVGRQRSDTVAVTRQALGRTLQRGLVPVDEQHGRAARQQFAGDCAADATAATGHQSANAGRLHADFRCGAPAAISGTAVSRPRNMWP
jgi:hypothetical protein